MKKATFPDIVASAIMLYGFWLLVTGQIVSLVKGEPNIQVLIYGVIVSLAVAAFSSRFFIHESPFYLYNPARLLTLIFYCLVIFIIELTKANINVARIALNPKLPVNPGIVKVPVNLKSEYGQSMLSNSITLTPGTITLDIAEEKGQTYYYIHWIDVATQDHKEAGDEIKGTLEEWVGRIWK